MKARHLDETPEQRAEREWLTLLNGTADGTLHTTAIPQVPTVPLPSLTGVKAPPAGHPHRAHRIPAVLAALTGLVLGVALSEPFRALAAVLADVARDLTGGA